MALALLTACQTESPPADWRSEFALAKYLELSVDSDGFDDPIGLAFGPPPSSPAAPLYYVAERHGRIRAIDQDRNVSTWVDDVGALIGRGAVTLRTMCAGAQANELFVTAVDAAATSLVVRLQDRAAGVVASLLPTPVSTAPFGPCAVSREQLWLASNGVQRARDRRTARGKLIRMSSSGEPIIDNPLLNDPNSRDVSAFIWAVGLGEVVGLRVVGARVFVIQVGTQTASFRELEAGEDALGDGSRWSSGLNAALVGVGLTGPLDFISPRSSVFTHAYRGKFVFADDVGSVLLLDYDFAARRVRAAPQVLVEQRRGIPRPLTALVVGPDGLYLLPGSTDGPSRVLKVGVNPTAEYPYRVDEQSSLLDRDMRGHALMVSKGCFACHRMFGDTGVAPSLEPLGLRKRLDERLHSREYLALLDELDRSEDSDMRRYRAAREQVRREHGFQRLHTWVRIHVLEPAFDARQAKMPDFMLTESEASLIADFLLGTEADFLLGTEDMVVVRRSLRQVLQRWLQRLPPARYRYVFGALLLGVLAASVTRKRTRARTGQHEASGAATTNGETTTLPTGHASSRRPRPS